MKTSAVRRRGGRWKKVAAAPHDILILIRRQGALKTVLSLLEPLSDPILDLTAFEKADLNIM